jgi:hypothetical protein
MRALSASAAITPAFDRTRAVLFQPFQIGRSWKLAATAYLAMLGGVFLPTPLIWLVQHPHAGRHGAALLQVILPFVVLLGCAIAFLFFYIGARLQFARFDIVLRGEKKIAPLWRRCGPLVGRWIGLKLGLSGLFFILFGAPLAFLFSRFMANLQFVPGRPPAPYFVLHLFLVEALLFLSIFSAMFCSSLLDDFILPSIALEGVPLSEAFRRFAALVRSELGPVVYYVFLKALLAVGCGIALEVAIIFGELVIAIPLALIGLLGWLLLHTLGPAGHILLVAGVIVLILAFAVLILYLIIGLIGAVLLFFQAYALYFLGGRYPMLGDLLEPLPSSFAYPPPPPPAPAPPPLPSLQPHPEPPIA